MVSHRARGPAALRIAPLFIALSLVSALGGASVHRADAAAPVSPARVAFTPSAALPLYNYGFDTTQGSGLVSNLVADQQGALYGTTQGGGTTGYGTVFQLTRPKPGETAWHHTVIHSFCQSVQCTDGTYPAAGVIFAEQPNHQIALFGTTEYGGANGYGTVFRLLPSGVEGTSWQEDVLYSFARGSDGANPLAHLTADTSGALTLYGTTNAGGTGDCSGGCGTVFELRPPNNQHPHNWAETVLHSFGGGSDGAYPKAGVVADAEHALYGTTYKGGSGGYGSIFRLSPPAVGGSNWSQTVIYSFQGVDDGSYPRAGLLLEPGGGLYGTTAYGGANCDNPDGCGTVFKLVPGKTGPTWTLTTLHAFAYLYPDNGQYPLGDLIFGEDGAIYGTTEYGGTPVGDGNGPCDFLQDCGLVFRLTGQQTAWDFSIVYKFCTADGGCPVGSHPTAGLTTFQGELYGTTSYTGYGEACGCGAIFALSYPSDDAVGPPSTTSPPATAPTTLPPTTVPPMTSRPSTSLPYGATSPLAAAAVPVTAAPKFTG